MKVDIRGCDIGADGGNVMINFRVLGPLEARKADRPLPLGGRKQRGVLAILLLNANRTVPVDRLISGVWNGRAPGHPLNTLQVYVSNLRRVLESNSSGDRQELLITQEPGYRIEATSEQLDMLQFMAAAARGRCLLDESRYEEAGSCLHDALALWRGPALADLLDEPFAEGELVALEESRLAAIEARMDADLAVGRPEEIVGELNSLVIDHPYRERFRGLLMLALYRSGRQAEALEVYQDTRRIMLDDLGVDPGPELRQLERSILAQVKLGNIQRRARPFVLFHDGGGEQHVVELDAAQSPLTIGRRSSNDLSLAWDQEVSRVHAYLERAGAGWELVDEGRSRNGSYVNGERVDTRYPLRDADVVRVGTTVLFYRAPASGVKLSRTTGATADALIRSVRQIGEGDLAVLRALAHGATQAGQRAERLLADSLRRTPQEIEATLHLLYKRFGVAHLAEDERKAILLSRVRSLGVLPQEDE